MEGYIEYKGKDLGVIIGSTGGKLVIYQPTDDFVPTSGNLRDLRDHMPVNVLGINYNLVRQVFVDGNSIWRNRDIPDLIGEHRADYSGRGQVRLLIRLKEDLGVELEKEVIERIIANSKVNLN